MEKDSHPTFGNGKICYLEIPAVDINESASFYKTVFGWSIRNDDDGNITFDDGVGEVSGMWVLGMQPSLSTGIVISIMVDDLLATLQLIITNGGKIIKEANLDAPQKTAAFCDPAGNLFSLYQP